MRQKFMSFMRGRYGVDKLSNTLLWIAFALMMLNLFVRKDLFYFLGIILLIYTYYRMFSRNIVKRSRENEWYLNKTYGIRMRLLKSKDRAKLRKTHHIYKCPECGQKVKVPRGHGKIEVTCPKCSMKFVRRS